MTFMILHSSRFNIVVTSCYMLALSREDDYGLYGKHTRGDLDTPLLARGTFAELLELKPDAEVRG